MTANIRQLGQSDMLATALVHRASFDHRLPWLAGAHTAAQDQAYFGGPVFAECEVWGAWEESTLVAFIAFRTGWVDHLYVLPSFQAQGLGGRLLDVAKRRRSQLSLWTFQRNHLARRFYEARGFIVVETTDGSRNMEREPDVLYAWRA